MKKALIYAMIVFVAAAFLAVSPAKAERRDIAVPDAGFEDHVLTAVDDWFYLADDTTNVWKSVSGTGGAWIGWDYYGVWLAHSGNNKVYGNYETEIDYIYQILDETFIAGKTYTLSVWVGSGWSGYANNWWLYFTGEDYTNELAETSGSASLFLWKQVSLVYTATAADDGNKIGIKMQGDAWVTFDDVSLSYGPPKTMNPSPVDGSMIEDTWVNLSWSPGDRAVSSDVYIGDTFDQVNDATVESPEFRGNQTAATYIIGFPGFAYPDGLRPGTTYFWRTDAVNDSEPNSPWKGDVWSFSIPPKTAYDPDPAAGAEFVGPNVTLNWTPGYAARLHHVYFGDSFADVNDGTGDTYKGIAAGETFSPGPLESESVFYWRVDEFDSVETHKGDIWGFTTPGAVGNPQPDNGSAGVNHAQILSWTPADNAAYCEVYFGTEAESVRNATTASPEHVGTRSSGSESYDPGKLAWDTAYFWRVDAVYDSPDARTVKGLVWSFAAADFIAVDDFESYNDVDPPEAGSNRIFEAWTDGFGIATNGALVGNELPPYTEQTIVHSGGQSMPLSYDNNLMISEATMTLIYPRDWTEQGVTKLSLWFRGKSSNAAEKIFVALNGNAVVHHDDENASQTSTWTEWIIDLQAFADQGVGLTNVNTIAIGLGNKSPGAPGVVGGAGEMFIDDIRLYR
jgi:hypothetical protein